MAEMLATNPLPAHIRVERQIAGFQAPAFPAAAGQLPVLPGRIKVRRVLRSRAQ
jgi:hypothetical protein